MPLAGVLERPEETWRLDRLSAQAAKPSHRVVLHVEQAGSLPVSGQERTRLRLRVVGRDPTFR